MPDTLLDDLLAMERRVWQALATGDGAADAALLAPDFLGVYPTGFADRDSHAAQLAGGPTVTAWRIEAPRVMALADGLGLLAYRAVFRRPGADADEAMYVSSLWQRQGGAWVNLYSQDTPEGAALP